MSTQNVRIWQLHQKKIKPLHPCQLFALEVLTVLAIVLRQILLFVVGVRGILRK